MSTLKKVLLGVILLTAVAVSGVHFFDLPHIAKAETNAAPPFTVTDMNGQTVSLASLKGKPVFLNFWATWCPPCVGEMPDIQRMYAKYGDKVHFVIVNIDGTQPDVAAFMENHAQISGLVRDSDEKRWNSVELSPLVLIIMGSQGYVNP